ncbi:helix-hairpin-helix domain-containing protein [Gordonia caeni]|uniref:Helix-hairpin-helix DNA-binding motif class 1 domain-containing protein n=1 Tax=Gordonia caeni TaxID=1007097 RepID=A0ABP7NYR0_9ACTN
MARRSSTSARSGLDRLHPPRTTHDRDDSPAGRRADDWGDTAMPAWLDTTAGRRAWAGRETAGRGRRDGEDDGHWDEVLDGEPADADDDDFYDAPSDEDDETGDGDGDEDWDEDWGEPPRRRLTMLPPAAIGLIGVGVIACVIAGFTLLRNTEPAAPLVDIPISAGPISPAAETPAPSSAVSEIVVSVAGLVHKPGLVRLPPSARVAQALERAGGTRENADVLSLNLAQILHDGDQVLVGTRAGGAGAVRSAVVSSGAGPAPPSGGAGGSAPGTAGGAVNLNTATAAELDTLPGVGPVTAQAIISWREQHGGFSSVDQLAEVDGIGPARLAKLRDAATVGG